MAARNVKCEVVDGKLILTVDLSAAGVASASGKSEVLGSTGGNLDVPGAPGVKVGLNVYRASGGAKGAGW